MKVQVIHPHIDKYAIRLEPGDADYRKCIWADILIDHDAYAITAQTDCGDYAYRWAATPQTESFRDLCLRMLDDEDYLLEKFSDEDVFSLEESKLLFADTHSNPEDRALTEKVNAIHVFTVEEWSEALEELGVKEPWEYTVMEYPPRAVRFVRMLKNIVLPEMRMREEREIL